MQTIDLRAPLAQFGADLAEAARLAFATSRVAVRVWWRTLRTRGGLAEMDDRMLSDLGISRAQAAFELSRAPWDAARR